jgi:hypothetical protein
MRIKPYVRKVTLTTEYQALDTHFNMDTWLIIVPTNNSGTTYILSDDGETDVPVPKGVPISFPGINLFDLQFKGTAEDVVTIFGTCHKG